MTLIPFPVYNSLLGVIEDSSQKSRRVRAWWVEEVCRALSPDLSVDQAGSEFRVHIYSCAS